MLHPVGSEPPSVYWRRRLILLGAVALVLVLIALTVSAATGGSGTPQAGGSATPTPGASSTKATTPRASSTAAAPRTSAKASTSASTGAASSSGATVAVCTPAALKVVAVVGKSTYKVGDKLLMELQVTNTGAKPCVQDLSDKQIELRVYNGASRVWGSHDCAVQPGTDMRTLAVGQPYRSAVLWGGLTSEPNCTQSARQRIGAGTYTLYAALAGRTGTAAQFNVS